MLLDKHCAVASSDDENNDKYGDESDKELGKDDTNDGNKISSRQEDSDRQQVSQSWSVARRPTSSIQPISNPFSNTGSS